MAHPNISHYRKITLLGKLLLPHDMADSYRAYCVMNNYICASNTYTQLGFTSYDFLGEFPKLLKKFETYDMDDRKVISSRNSINTDELTKIYAHIICGLNKQTT